MESLAGILINVGVPAAGFLLYESLCRRIDRSGIEKPPKAALFILFSVFGGWLLIILTLLFWYWSGMATLGFFGLLFVAPLVIGPMSFYLYQRRAYSKFHSAAFIASVVYICFIVAVLAYLTYRWKVIGK
jgi:hypothetical protein